MFDKTKKTAEDVARETIEALKIKAAAQTKIDADKKASQTPPADSSTETKKPEDEKKSDTPAPDENKQVEKDESLLNTSDEDAAKLPEEDKTRREALKEKKKSGFQKRIDELVRQREEEKEKREALEARLKELESKFESSAAPNPEILLKTAEQERIRKYLIEDAEKSREERREMSKEELNEWMLEDSLAATEWITQQAVRRVQEKESDKRQYEIKVNTEKLLREQQPYIDLTVKEHPELDTTKRENELRAAGKNNKEIFDTLCKENPKYNVVQQILKENPQYFSLINGPVLAVREMERRLGSSKKSGESEEEKEGRIRGEAAEAERQRQAAISAASGDGSSFSKKEEEQKTELDVAQAEIAKMAGIPMERLQKRLEERRKKGL